MRQVPGLSTLFRHRRDTGHCNRGAVQTDTTPSPYANGEKSGFFLEALSHGMISRFAGRYGKPPVIPGAGRI